MKKHLLFVCALLLAGIGASAQSVDVSSKLLGNAQGNWTNATGTYSGGAERYQTANYTASDGKILYQTITGLDNGIYEVTLYAVASSTSSRGFDNISGTGYAQVFANSTAVDVTVIDQTGCTPSEYEYTLTCEVTNGTLEFGLQNVGTGGNWYVCQGISLIYSGTALNTGDTYYASVADICQWSITNGITDANFHRNNWSDEADASGMVTPFLEYWMGSGTNLSDAVISHQTLTDLPQGLYELSVFARAFNENSTTAVGKGITFDANGTSVDLTTGTAGTYNGVSAEVYGTYTLVAEVGTAGTLDLGFTIQSETSCDWVAWKNLKIVYDGESLPTLEYVDGIMNADVEAAMKAAVDAYNSSKSTDDYATAVSAIAAAEASVEYYAPIVAIVEALDADGLAAWNATTNGQAYAARSLTSEDVSADLITAQLAQTTEGSDMSYVLQNTGSWSAPYDSNNNGAPGTSAMGYTESYTNSNGGYTADEGQILYKTITGLQPGTYEVTFYAAANVAWITASSGSNIAQAFANDGTPVSMTVGTENAYTFTESDKYTITCTVGMDGTLTFGIENVGSGGNWYVAQEVSLTLVELTEITMTVVQDKVFLKNVYGGDLVSRGKQLGTAADVDFIGTPLTLVSYDGGASVVIWYSDVDLNDEAATGAYLGGTNWASANKSLSDATYFTMTETTYTDSDGNTATGYQFTSDYGLLYRYDAASTPETGSSADNTYRLAVNGSNTENYSDASQAIWVIVDTDERDAIKAQWVAEQKVAVAQAAGLTDITTEAGFDTFVAGQTETQVYSSTLGTEDIVASDGWTTSGTPGYYWDGGAYGVEAYYANDPGYARLSHEITGLDEGIYKLTLNGLDRNSTPAYSTEMYSAGYKDLSESYLEANGYETNLQPWASEGYWSDVTDYYYPNLMDESSEMFENGSYLNTLYTYVGADGTLDINIALLVTEYFGWATVKNLNVYSVYTAEDTYKYDVTKMLANPSFETPTVSELAGDEDADKRGSYAVTDDQLTGWTLVAPTNADDASRAVCDIMTKDASETDDDYGVPGTPSDEKQMLYLRNSWTTGTASVTQSVTLPAGSYKLTVDSKCVTTISDHSATLVVNDASVTLPTHSAYDGDNLAWDTSSLTFVVTDDTEAVTFGVNVSFDGHPGLSVLLDNFRLYSETDVVVWTMTDAGTGTLVLPFDATLPSGLTAYTAAALSSSELTLSTDGSNAVTANTPYVITGTATAAGTYYFTGDPGETVASTPTDDYGYLTGVLPAVAWNATNDHLVSTPTAPYVSSGDYVLQNHTGASGLAFYVVENDNEITCASYHCYIDGEALKYAGAKAVTIVFGDGTTTGIEAVDSEAVAGSDVIYDLSGRRVLKAQKGVYIVNGRKVVIK